MTFQTNKRRSEEDEFAIVREYLLACPLVSNPSENPAIRAAWKGLDSEIQRRERDAKLQKKFSQQTISAAIHEGSSATQDDEWTDIANDDSKPANLNRGDLEDVEIISMDGDTSVLGKQLAEIAIAAIAESKAKSKSPLAAIALALHAAMRSETLGFACTGSAADNSPSLGFAPPIRELPKEKFLPNDWDHFASSSEKGQQRVVLRYRKHETGSVLLKVGVAERPSAPDSQEITVRLVPANTKEPPSQHLVFALGHHVNLDSWALRASASSFGVEPALHYKALPALMTSFAKTFDLGSVNDVKQTPDKSSMAFIGVQTANPKPSGMFQRDHDIPPKPIIVGQVDPRTPTIGGAFPPRRPMFVGDFAGDLTPGGGVPVDPLRRLHPGNLMGPNHPVFQGGGMTGVGDASGFGMKPRFDPFGPPGGPQEIHPPGANGQPVPPHLRRPQSGNPNPDHLRPPNSLGGNNMFL